MNNVSIAEWLVFGLMPIGYIFIVVTAFRWLVSGIFRQRDKRRKQDRKQRAVNELYDAFELDKLIDGSTMHVATKGDLIIMMYRRDK
ncbi:DUF4752 family protein [Pantoea dispersa]|uniref:DUF4752 family protein n=1 Tax=Pantoea dispersa TaxID=59814 RepID=UPI0039B51B47